ncbi:MAG: hypothetical protein ACPGVU_07780 [Limisphaerales bacterium]
MNDPRNRMISPLDQPGYWQFYANEEAERAWSTSRLKAGNRLIALGLGGLTFVGLVMAIFKSLN